MGDLAGPYVSVPYSIRLSRQALTVFKYLSFTSGVTLAEHKSKADIKASKQADFSLPFIS
jgi:hypothetical protein